MEDRFVAINAWNEWAEGMAIEPSDVYEYGWLEVIRTVKTQVQQEDCPHTRDGTGSSSAIQQRCSQIDQLVIFSHSDTTKPPVNVFTHKRNKWTFHCSQLCQDLTVALSLSHQLG